VGFKDDQRRAVRRSKTGGGGGPLRVLFLCARNRRRSPTAEAVFAGRPGLEVAAAGLAPDAEEVVTPETLAWADLIVVMEPAHRAKLRRQFGPHLKHARVVCLDIPDRYAFMDPALVALLEARVGGAFAEGLRLEAETIAPVVLGPVDEVDSQIT
jgi:predicted protein tyrosine phosphatase